MLATHKSPRGQEDSSTQNARSLVPLGHRCAHVLQRGSVRRIHPRLSQVRLRRFNARGQGRVCKRGGPAIVKAMRGRTHASVADVCAIRGRPGARGRLGSLNSAIEGGALCAQVAILSLANFGSYSRGILIFAYVPSNDRVSASRRKAIAFLHTHALEFAASGSA